MLVPVSLLLGSLLSLSGIVTALPSSGPAAIAEANLAAIVKRTSDAIINGECSADGRGCVLSGTGLNYGCNVGGVSMNLYTFDLF